MSQFRVRYLEGGVQCSVVVDYGSKSAAVRECRKIYGPCLVSVTDAVSHLYRVVHKARTAQEGGYEYEKETNIAATDYASARIIACEMLGAESVVSVSLSVKAAAAEERSEMGNEIQWANRIDCDVKRLEAA